MLVKPWGLDLDWQQLSYASLVVTALWIVMALRARRGYLTAFRQSIERRDVAPAEVRLSGADLSTIETLVAGARASRAGARASTRSTCSSRSTSATW